MDNPTSFLPQLLAEPVTLAPFLAQRELSGLLLLSFPPIDLIEPLLVAVVQLLDPPGSCQ